MRRHERVSEHLLQRFSVIVVLLHQRGRKDRFVDQVYRGFGQRGSILIPSLRSAPSRSRSSWFAGIGDRLWGGGRWKTNDSRQVRVLAIRSGSHFHAMAAVADSANGPLSFSGHEHLRHRLVLSILSGRPVRIDKIRSTDANPGLRGPPFSPYDRKACDRVEHVRHREQTTKSAS
jgi:hypothetical protein